MKSIIVIGAGGHAAEIDEYIQMLRRSEDIQLSGFIDDNSESHTKYKFSAPYLGTIKAHQVSKEVTYIMGIANMAYRKKIVDRFLDGGAIFTNVIHPTAYISKSAVLGEGIVVGPYVNIGPNAKVGNFTLLNARVSVGHDTRIGNYNFISPNVSFSGFTSVGDENLFGINSATIPGIKIGNNNKIAAGMVLDKNVENDQVVFYRFKERVVVTQNSL
jgi:sugar O-acyltransferase (sialic acid O-acetyltransferase NeuD family)